MPRGVGDVGDVDFGGHGGVEGGNAQILPPLGAGKMPRKGNEGMIHVKVSGIVLEGYHIKAGGHIHKIMRWVDPGMGPLGLPNSVRLHEAQENVNGGGEREEAHHAHCGDIFTECPPQLSGPRPPPKVRAAGEGAEVVMYDLGRAVGGGGSRMLAVRHTDTSGGAGWFLASFRQHRAMECTFYSAYSYRSVPVCPISPKRL